MTAELIGKIHDTVTAITAPVSDVFQHMVGVCEGIRCIVYTFDSIVCRLCTHTHMVFRWHFNVILASNTCPHIESRMLKRLATQTQIRILLTF